MEIIDLFCGAGGFSLGAHLAGFHTVLAVDKDATLTSSFLRNFPKSKLQIADLQHVSGRSLLKKAGLVSGSNLGIIGGPPCQGFSLMGKRALTDPRNELLSHFFRIVREIQPRFFVMENVPGLLLGSAKAFLMEALEGLEGYDILGPVIVNANDYGAATLRERVIVIGFKGTNPITVEMLAAAKSPIKPTVADAIKDIPSPCNSGTAPYRRMKHVSTYALNARTASAFHSDVTSPLMTVRDISPTAHKADVIARFSSIMPGKADPISRFPRLSWHKPAPTLRAGTGSDHGSFQAVRPIHPKEPRVITVREAARLQGFPDWFEFHETKWHSFRMIGNSVSPAVARALLRVIAPHA